MNIFCVFVSCSSSETSAGLGFVGATVGATQSRETDGKVTVPSDLIFVYDHSCEVEPTTELQLKILTFSKNWYFLRVFFLTE